ncbi:hypothetical protein EV356DRAFT_310207 [Viridothelium virens]|uniref:F-box domain-containing protein n=1 Tax=Viridothelium virens TaxID=1048519 RepID=A0A6A6H088_VIRVR|nr:hypothetical protein EV356DRAFT_310207 [Viridothelium virens]
MFSPSNANVGKGPSRFLDLPAEIRNIIYRFCLISAAQPLLPCQSPEGLQPQILRLNRKIHDEACSVLYGDNTYVWEWDYSPEWIRNMVKHLEILLDALVSHWIFNRRRDEGYYERFLIKDLPDVRSIVFVLSEDTWIKDSRPSNVATYDSNAAWILELIKGEVPPAEKVYWDFGPREGNSRWRDIVEKSLGRPPAEKRSEYWHRKQQEGFGA